MISPIGVISGIHFPCSSDPATTRRATGPASAGNKVPNIVEPTPNVIWAKPMEVLSFRERAPPTVVKERNVLTVFLVDDHEVVRRGVGDLLDEEDDLTVVGQAGTVAEALTRIPALRPDIEVLDMRPPDG